MGTVVRVMLGRAGGAMPGREEDTDSLGAQRGKGERTRLVGGGARERVWWHDMTHAARRSQ